VPHAGNAEAFLTSSGRAAWVWLRRLSDRLERVRVVHGDWSRCLNNHFGGSNTAVFIDPPYRSYEKLYGVAEAVADAVAEWARDNADLRIALCGHIGDYELPGWDAQEWSRGRLTYAGGTTTEKECIWYSPACIGAERDLFSAPRFDPDLDSLLSYNTAVEAVGDKVKAGAPVPEFFLSEKDANR